MTYFTTVAIEESASSAENRRFSTGGTALRVTTRRSFSAGHLPYDLPTFHVPANSGALHGDALSRLLLAAGKGDDVGLLTSGGAVSAVRSGTLETAVLPDSLRDTLPAEAVQAGQQVGVLQLSATLDARHRRLPLGRGWRRDGLRLGHFFERGGHTVGSE